MKSGKIKRGRMNITDQSICMGVIFIVTGLWLLLAIQYTVNSGFVCHK